MIAGVSEQEQQIIKNILADYEPEFQFWAYGSRVKGTFSRLSDLDVLIKGQAEMPAECLDELKYRFDESALPYVVNFCDYHKIDDSFYLGIEKDLSRL